MSTRCGSGNTYRSRGFIGSTYVTSEMILGYAVKAGNWDTQNMVVTETHSGIGAPAAIRMKTGRIEFYTADSGVKDEVFDSERMRITNTGNVGIGAQLPDSRLNIQRGGDLGISNVDTVLHLENDADDGYGT